MHPEVDLLHGGAGLDVVFHLSNLPDVFIPSVDATFETISKRDVFDKVIKVADFACLLPFAGSINAVFHVGIANELDHWDFKILATLSQVHLKAREFFKDAV